MFIYSFIYLFIYLFSFRLRRKTKVTILPVAKDTDNPMNQSALDRSNYK